MTDIRPQPETIEISHTLDGVTTSFRIETRADGTALLRTPSFDPEVFDTDGGLFAVVRSITANPHGSR
ncbi:MAG: hypothetical protein FD119_3727 [Stygiobacter sp.]|nr:MAG: hypothetical protein FD119_3727 [Stygiobacter sp.]